MDLRTRSVSEIMGTEVVTLESHETLDLTQDIMRLGRVRHMPVIDDGHLVGIVSHRDLLEASLSKAVDPDPRSRRAFLHSVEVSAVMAKDVVTVSPETSLEEAARILVQRQIGCVPVVDREGKLLGLVTETDLVSAAFLEGPAGAEREQQGRGIDMTASAKFSDWIQGELDDLRQTRDELKLKAHLGKAELRDLWQKLEDGFEDLETRTKHTARMAEEPLRELEADARKVARDLRDGYRRIRDSI